MKLDIQLFAASTTITKTIKDSYNNSYIVTATINESLPSDYITTNKTLLSGTVTVSNTGSGGAYTSNKAMSATLTFKKNNADGEVLTSATGSCKFDFQGDATKTATPLTYNNLEISHETDGTRTIYAYLEIKISETSLKQTQHYNTTLALTTIPRASSVQITGNMYLNSTLTLAITRASSSFVHKLYYSFGSLENQTSGLSAYNNVGTSATFTPPLSLASQIPTSAYGTCTLTCETYNGSVSSANYVGKKSYNFTLQIASSQTPSSSIGTISEADTTMSSLNWGIFVVGKSKISFPVTVNPSYSSPTTLKVTVNNETYNESAVTTSTTTNYTTGYLTTVGENTISAKAEDRRNKSYTKNKTYTVYDYTSPEITEFDVFRCNSSGTASDEGTYIRYKFSASIDAVYDGTNNHNAHSFVLKFRVKGSTGSYTTITTQSGTLSNNKYSVTIPYTTYGSSTTTATNYFNPNSAYEFVLEVTDSFNTSSSPVSQTKYIETGFDLFNFNANGKAMAIGKVSEATGSNKLLEIALPMKTTDSVTINGGFIGRGCIVGQNNNTTSNPYYKFAEISIGSTYTDRSISFKVSMGYSDNSTKLGILTAHVRTNGSAYWDNSQLVWEYANSGIDLTKFILIHNTSTNPTKVELYAKCDATYQLYHFEVISEGTRETRNSPLWTLINNTTGGGGLAELPSGYTSQTSTLGTIRNNISGSASKLGTSTVGGSDRPIYLNSGTATQCGTPTSGSFFQGIPYVRSSGMIEIGRYIDFHPTNDSTLDYSKRIDAGTGTTARVLTLPDKSGTFELAPITLYTGDTYTTDNNIGTATGSVTLSETSANFTYIEIFYRAYTKNVYDNYRTGWSSVKVPYPNGKKVQLMLDYDNGTYWYHCFSTWTFDGTSLTKNNEMRWRVAASTAAQTRTDNTTSDPTVSICKIVGYR